MTLCLLLLVQKSKESMSVFLSVKGLQLRSPLGMHLVTSFLPQSSCSYICIGNSNYVLTVDSFLSFAELFDLYIIEGESMREWLFFDKPRRAFDSGNRKQRSLPDYNGHGWHESRKQVMKDFGGLKRSYYMDPQPSSSYEWHLYEYEINDRDAFALYRLEFKSSDAKKSAKSKFTCSPLIEIQQQMVRLSADGPMENKRTAHARTKDGSANIYPVQNNIAQGNAPDAYQAASQVDQMTFLNGSVVYGPHLPYGYSTEGGDFYWNSNDGS